MTDNGPPTSNLARSNAAARTLGSSAHRDRHRDQDLEPMMEARDTEIRQARAAKQAQDTKIAQKVLSAHREAFREKFPGQVEHLLRLTAERLHQCLLKPEGIDLADPLTWPASAEDILALARALESLWIIHREQPRDDR